jgi:hypothetical protein
MVISKACAALLMAFSKTLLIADVRSLRRLDAGAADRERPAAVLQLRTDRRSDIAIDQIQSRKEKGRGSRGLFAM